MKTLHLVIFLLITLHISVFIPLQSRAHDTGGLFAEMFSPGLYEDESAFTLIPARIGSITFALPAYIIGGTVYLAGYTLGLPFDKEDEFSAVGVYTGLGILRLGGYAAGAPFYAIEKTFYDIPLSRLRKKETDTVGSKPIGILKENHSVMKTEAITQIQHTTSRTEKIIEIDKVDSNDCMPKPIVGAGKAVIQTGLSLQFSSGYCNQGPEGVTLARPSAVKRKD